MGFKDTLKTKLAPAKDKVSDLAQQHEEKFDRGLDKAAKLVDEKTKGKYSDKIHSHTDKAKGAYERLAHKEDMPHEQTEEGGTTPPSASPPPPPPAP
ncbi:antitoxin [Streptomyces sp. NPDC002004]